MLRQQSRLNITLGFISLLGACLLACSVCQAKLNAAPAAISDQTVTLFLPKTKPVPSGIVIMDLPVSSERMPKVEFQQTRQTVIFGRHVSQGTEIRTVDNTGRTIGTHLHWTVVLNKARINPLLFVNKSQLTRR